jgi:exopolysaccharide biosynthesis predicted pyruvyltransferase EpsI
VQLPQSIEYTQSKNLAEDAEALASLPAGMFHIMARTKASVQLALDNFKSTPTYGSPDQAFALGPLSAPKPTVDVVVLLRWDAETKDMEKNVDGEWMKGKFQDHNLTMVNQDWAYGVQVGQEASKVKMLVPRINSWKHGAFIMMTSSTYSL